MRDLFKTVGVAATIVLWFALFSCNEQLPEYETPKNFLSGSISPVNAEEDTVRYFMIDNNNPNLNSVSITSTLHGYDIHLINHYEETIHDDADVQGTLTLQWNDNPQYKAEITLNATSINDNSYDPNTNMITLDPGDTLTLRTLWNFKFTNGDWAFHPLQYVDGPFFFVFPKVEDNFRYHAPMSISASVRAKIFKSLSYIETKKQESFDVRFLGRIRHPE